MSAVLIIAGLIALAVLTVVALVFRRVLLDLAADKRRAQGGTPTAKEMAAAEASKGCVAAFWLGLGPTLALVLAYEFAPVESSNRLFAASAVFAGAVLAALVYRLAKPIPDKSRFPWRNLAAFAMAGLTVALHNPFFVQFRPTLTNVIAVLLAGAALAGVSPRLEGIFKRDSISLDDAGWRKLVAGSMLLFVAMAAANEYVRRSKSEAFWVHFQLWGPPLFFLAFMIVGYLVIKSHLPAGQCPAKPRAEHSEPSNDL